MKVNITYIRNEDKVSKAGKKYTACSIKTTEHGDTWLNGFGNAQTKDLEEAKMALPQGEALPAEIEVYQEEYNGNMQTKFKTISEVAVLQRVVKDLYARVKALEAKSGIAPTTPAPAVTTPAPIATPNVAVDDLPF